LPLGRGSTGSAGLTAIHEEHRRQHCVMGNRTGALKPPGLGTGDHFAVVACIGFTSARLVRAIHAHDRGWAAVVDKATKRRRDRELVARDGTFSCSPAIYLPRAIYISLLEDDEGKVVDRQATGAGICCWFCAMEKSSPQAGRGPRVAGQLTWTIPRPRKQRAPGAYGSGFDGPELKHLQRNGPCSSFTCWRGERSTGARRLAWRTGENRNVLWVGREGPPEPIDSTRPGTTFVQPGTMALSGDTG